MDKYVVYQNNKPAKYPEIDVHESWSNCTFDTLQEAQEYAAHWSGSLYSPGRYLKLDEEYEYSGYGDCVCIRYHKVVPE